MFDFAVGQFLNACMSLEVRKIRRLISKGVDINGIDSKCSQTGLMMALSSHSSQSLEIVKILLGCYKIRIDIKNKYGDTALHYACDFNNIEGVKLLLEHPDCNKETSWGRAVPSSVQLS